MCLLNYLAYRTSSWFKLPYFALHTPESKADIYLVVQGSCHTSRFPQVLTFALLQLPRSVEFTRLRGLSFRYLPFSLQLTKQNHYKGTSSFKKEIPSLWHSHVALVSFNTAIIIWSQNWSSFDVHRPKYWFWLFLNNQMKQGFIVTELVLAVTGLQTNKPIPACQTEYF